MGSRPIPGFGPAKDCAGVLGEQRQKVDSFGVSRHGPPVDRTSRVRGSTVKRATCGSGTLSGTRTGRPARDGTDASEELAEAERLDDVVVRAELQSDDPVDLLRHGPSTTIERHVRLAAQAPADLEAVDVGQP